MPCWRSESASAAISRRVEITARLERIGVDPIDWDVRKVGRVEGAGLESPFLAPEQGFQAASESSLIHGR